jgi:hypothetical protein
LGDKKNVNLHHRRDSPWAARLYAQAPQGTRASAGLLVQATPETPRGGRRAHVDNALSYLNSRSIRDAGTAALWEGRTHKDTPVELKDAHIYFCVRSSVTQRCVVEPIDILSYKWADYASMLQRSESEMGWVWQGVPDG